MYDFSPKIWTSNPRSALAQGTFPFPNLVLTGRPKTLTEGFHGGHQLLHERRRTCVPGAVMGTIKSMAGNWVCVIPSTIMTPLRVSWWVRCCSGGGVFTAGPAGAIMLSATLAVVAYWTSLLVSCQVAALLTIAPIVSTYYLYIICCTDSDRFLILFLCGETRRFNYLVISYPPQY